MILERQQETRKTQTQQRAFLQSLIGSLYQALNFILKTAVMSWHNSFFTHGCNFYFIPRAVCWWGKYELERSLHCIIEPYCFIPHTWIYEKQLNSISHYIYVLKNDFKRSEKALFVVLSAKNLHHVYLCRQMQQASSTPTARALPAEERFEYHPRTHSVSQTHDPKTNEHYSIISLWGEVINACNVCD